MTPWADQVRDIALKNAVVAAPDVAVDNEEFALRRIEDHVRGEPEDSLAADQSFKTGKTVEL